MYRGGQRVKQHLLLMSHILNILNLGHKTSLLYCRICPSTELSTTQNGASNICGTTPFVPSNICQALRYHPSRSLQCLPRSSTKLRLKEAVLGVLREYSPRWKDPRHKVIILRHEPPEANTQRVKFTQILSRLAALLLYSHIYWTPLQDQDGYFVFRYLLVDIPSKSNVFKWDYWTDRISDSRSHNPVRVFVERQPGVRENEPVMRWVS